MKILGINRLRLRTNGGGGGGMKGGGAAPSAPPPPPPPPTEDQGPDPAMQAEIERQRALRFKAGQLGTQDTTGSGTDVQPVTEQTNTLLGQ